MVRKIRFTVAYDGSAFVGFQRQQNGMAVQEVLENALVRILGVPTPISFVSRTDSGVHAWAQECSFFTEGPIPGAHFQRALNALLPESVRVRSSSECDLKWNIRKANSGKTYVYQIHCSRMDNPFWWRYVWRLGYSLDVNKMQKAAAVLIGTHDFTSFRGNNAVQTDPIRTIRDIHLCEKDDLLRIYVTGDGFLYKMVRNIVGALVDVGRGAITVADVVRILAERDRRRLGMTAPGQGLCLLHIYFDSWSQEAYQKVLNTPVPIWNEGI